MKKLRFLSLAAPAFGLACIGSDHANAQVVCGPGTHSTIAGYQVPDYSYCALDEVVPVEPVQAPPPEPVWEDRWGAITTGEGSYGTAQDFRTEAGAINRAVLECQASSNGKPCRVRLTYYNQCAALASGDGGSIAFSNASEQGAQSAALNACKQHTTNCQVVWSGCSLPVQVQ